MLSNATNIFIYDFSLVRTVDNKENVTASVQNFQTPNVPAKRQNRAKSMSGM